MPDLEIIYRAPGDLRDNPDNAKRHPAKQLARLERSIKTFGFLAPVLIDASDMILCGHGRVQAARGLGVETIPTIRVDHLSEVQNRAFVIADNKIAEQGTWDEQQLATEFQTILALGGDALDPLSYQILLGIEEKEALQPRQSTVTIEFVNYRPEGLPGRPAEFDTDKPDFIEHVPKK